MHDEKLDLSALDPTRDTHHWNQLVESVVARALARRQQPLTVGYQMLVWARPILAIAAALALVFGIRELLPHERNASSRSVEPAFVLASWAANDERPDTTRILQVLGSANNERPDTSQLIQVPGGADGQNQ
jgi:hypothetical protein